MYQYTLTQSHRLLEEIQSFSKHQTHSKDLGPYWPGATWGAEDNIMRTQSADNNNTGANAFIQRPG